MPIDTACELARLLLAGMLLAAAGGKLADPRGGARSVRGFGVPGVLAWPVAVALPLVELALAAGLVVDETARASAVAAACLLTLFGALIAFKAIRGERADCGCFGRLRSSKIGVGAAARNGVLAGVALWVAATPARPLGWFEVGAALGIAALVGQGVLWYALLRRYGRALRRIEELMTDGDAPGLGVGVEAPGFDLPNLDGARVTLSDLLARGRPVLLAFVDSRCGPCKAVLPDLGRWQRELAQELTVAIVGRGDAVTLRAMTDDRELELLVSGDGAVGGQYAIDATPCAVIVGTNGTIASRLRCAADGIGALVEDIAHVGHVGHHGSRRARRFGHPGIPVAGHG